MWQVLQDVPRTREKYEGKIGMETLVPLFVIRLRHAITQFSTCATAKSVWRIIGAVFGTSSYPNLIWQCFTWFRVFWPADRSFTLYS